MGTSDARQMPRAFFMCGDGGKVWRPHILPAAAIVITAVACSSIDCPLNSRVMLACKFGDEADRLADSLTVSTTNEPINQ